MALNYDKVTADIQTIVGPSVPVNLSSVELDCILGLEEPYREVAICRAAKGQLDRLGKAEESRILAQTIAQLEIELALKEIEEYDSNRAWVDKYKFEVTYPTVDPNWKNPDCAECYDTGWVCDYQGLHRYPCTSCVKGKEKEEKIVAKGAKAQQQQLELEKLKADKLLEQQAMKLQQIKSAVLQQTAQQQVAQNNQFLSGMLGGGAAIPGTEQSTTSITVPPEPPPAPTVKLPEVVGRKFRGVQK
jgi:hypothetical protein